MRRIIVGFIVGAVVAGGGWAFASIPDDDGTIRACYAKGNGAVRVIDPDSGGSCRASEEPLSWDEPLDLVAGEVSTRLSHTYAPDANNPCRDGKQVVMTEQSSGIVHLPVGTYRPVLHGERVVPAGTELRLVVHSGFRTWDQWILGHDRVREPGLLTVTDAFHGFYDVFPSITVPCAPGPTVSWDGTVAFLRVAD